jgi:hypothetical protein
LLSLVKGTWKNGILNWLAMGFRSMWIIKKISILILQHCNALKCHTNNDCIWIQIFCRFYLLVIEIPGHVKISGYSLLKLLWILRK